MTQDIILYRLEGKVAQIVLNAPKQSNAMTRAMAEALLDAVDVAEKEARAILITGADKNFSAGANLDNLSSTLEDSARDMGANLDRIINPLLMRLRGSALPVITAINGNAAGVGCGIGLAGDIVVAADNAVLRFSFANVGLVPDGGVSYALARAIGRVRASELLMLGGKVSAEEALQWGLVNRVVPIDELLATAMQIADRLANGARSLSQIKWLIGQALDVPFETALANERRSQRDAGRSSDFLEGISAFKERRAPEFQGM